MYVVELCTELCEKHILLEKCFFLYNLFNYSLHRVYYMVIKKQPIITEIF